MEEKLIQWVKDNHSPHGDSYSFRKTKKGKYEVKVMHDNFMRDSDVQRFVFTEEDLKKMF